MVYYSKKFSFHKRRKKKITLSLGSSYCWDSLTSPALTDKNLLTENAPIKSLKDPDGQFASATELRFKDRIFVRFSKEFTTLLPSRETPLDLPSQATIAIESRITRSAAAFIYGQRILFQSFF